MSIDEQVRAFMDGWSQGIDEHAPHESVSTEATDEAWVRGHDAGRAAYLAAEKAERERLTRCPDCFGTGWYEGRTKVCPTCHGTRRRA